MPEIRYLNCKIDVTLINANGTMVKNQKLKLLQSFVCAPLDFTNLQNYTAVIDMGFFWRLCVPTAEDREKRDKTKKTWVDYANKIFFYHYELTLVRKNGDICQRSV